MIQPFLARWTFKARKGKKCSLYSHHLPNDKFKREDTSVIIPEAYTVEKNCESNGQAARSHISFWCVYKPSHKMSALLSASWIKCTCPFSGSNPPTNTPSWPNSVLHMIKFEISHTKTWKLLVEISKKLHTWWFKTYSELPLYNIGWVHCFEHWSLMMLWQRQRKVPHCLHGDWESPQASVYFLCQQLVQLCSGPKTLSLSIRFLTSSNLCICRKQPTLPAISFKPFPRCKTVQSGNDGPEFATTFAIWNQCLSAKRKARHMSSENHSGES